jgi:hypothetical protein
MYGGSIGGYQLSLPEMAVRLCIIRRHEVHTVPGGSAVGGVASSCARLVESLELLGVTGVWWQSYPGLIDAWSYLRWREFVRLCGWSPMRMSSTAVRVPESAPSARTEPVTPGSGGGRHPQCCRGPASRRGRLNLECGCYRFDTSACPILVLANTVYRVAVAYSVPIGAVSARSR